MVSIIIPMYNVAEYIEMCLASFENQKYKNFEIIIIDDGSTDNSVIKVKEYINNSKMKIKLICQPNAGVSAARNKGIENSSGNYISFVDSDDMIGPDYISDMVDILDNNDCQMVICGTKNIPEHEKSNDILYSKEFKVEKMSSYDGLVKFLYREIHPGIWSLMVRREIIENNKLSFSEGYRYSEDIEMIFKMIANSNYIFNTTKQLYLYRTRNTSVMSLVDDKRFDGMKLMQGLELYFEKLRPDFSMEFRKFGVARWLWATLWQIGLASNNYKEFIRNSKKYNARFYMKKLIAFSKMKVSLSALIYIISPFIYFEAINYFVGKKEDREYKIS